MNGNPFLWIDPLFFPQLIRFSARKRRFFRGRTLDTSPLTKIIHPIVLASFFGCTVFFRRPRGFW